MSALDDARSTAADFLRRTAGSERPKWRAAFTTDGTDGPTGIAPVCPDPEHGEDDGDVWECCPDLAVEVGSTEFADYLVELLNADTGEKDTRGGSPQQGESTHLQAQAGGDQ